MTSHPLGGLAGSQQANVMAAILKIWRHIRNPTLQSTRINLKNNPAKFHPDPIWNDGALATLRLFEERRPKHYK